MRIILGIANYSQGYGMPNVVHNIARELLNQGNDVLVLSGKGNLDGSIPAVECGYSELIKQANINKTVRKIIEFKPDIFHSHYYPMDLCGALATHYKIPHVMHVHGVLSKEYWVNIKAASECIRSSFTESIGTKFSTKIIAISEFLKENIKRKYKVPPEKIEVIYPTIDLQSYSPLNRSKFGSQAFGDYVSLVCTGAITERKGQHLLVESMKQVIREEPKTRLSLIGRIGQEDGSYIFRLREKIKKYGLGNNVIIKGFVSASLLPKVYAQADIFVTGTMWEGFGMPIAEAMATGIPVVAFDTASMHELIINEFNGLKVAPFDTNMFAQEVLKLIRDSKLRRQIGRNGRCFAEKEFESKRNIHRLVEMYKSLQIGDL